MYKHCLLSIALVCALSASVGWASEFSAKLLEKRGDVTIKGVQYVKGGNVRQVVTSKEGKQVVISRADKKVTWDLNLEDKTYIETPRAVGDMSKMIAERAKRLADIKKSGTEKIQALVCDKYVFAYKSDKAGVGIQWVSQKLGWPIKTEIKSKSGDTLVELTEIKIEKQPAKLFEVPAGFKKIITPGMQPPKSK